MCHFMIKIRYVVVVFFVGLILKSLLYADIYVWVDDNGVKHFSNDESVQPNDRTAVQDEIECSEKDEKKWKQQGIDRKHKDELRKKLNAVQEQNETLRKNKCEEAKQYKQEVRQLYFVFAPEIYPDYKPGESGSRMQARNRIIERNEKNYEEWKQQSQEAHRRADELIEKYCQE